MKKQFSQLRTKDDIETYMWEIRNKFEDSAFGDCLRDAYLMLGNAIHGKRADRQQWLDKVSEALRGTGLV